MLKRRTRTLAATGITIAAIVSTTLGATGALTASPASAATAHATEASAAAVACQVRIQLGNTQWELWDPGPGQAVYLSPAPASCWQRLGPIRVKWYGVQYNAYVYKDLKGDCLWDDGNLIRTTRNCNTNIPSEEFFGIRYYHNGYDAPGWAITNNYWGPDDYMATDTIPPKEYTDIVMYGNGSPGTPIAGGAPFWNVP